MKEDTVKRQVLAGQGPKKDGSGLKARGEEGSRMGEREKESEGGCLEGRDGCQCT